MSSSDDEWYFSVGGCLGIGAAVISFVGSWWYCIAQYGYLFGFGLGWLPSLILAFIIFFAVRFLWGLALAGVALLLIFMYRDAANRPEPEPLVASSTVTTSSEWDSSTLPDIVERHSQPDVYSRDVADDMNDAAAEAAALVDAAAAEAAEAAEELGD